MAATPNTRVQVKPLKEYARIEDHPLVPILIEIRACQELCLRSQRSTFIGSMAEFADAHDVYARVQREQPVEKQKRLIDRMHEISPQVTDDDLNQIKRYVQQITGYRGI